MQNQYYRKTYIDINAKICYINIMERIFLRETKEEKLSFVVEKQKIGVVGISRSAGTTLIATSIAKSLSSVEGRKVTFLEISDCLYENRPLLYDSIGVDKRFKAREFTRFYGKIIGGENIRGMSNPDEQISWAIITPEDTREALEPAPIEIVRLINNIQGDLIICDISECKRSEDYLLDMDMVIVVIDPMPSAMVAGYPFMREVKRLEYKGKKVVWIINKYNSGINKRELLSYLKLKDFYKIPFISADNFYSAEYNCKIPYEVKGVKEAMKETIEKIIKDEMLI